MARLTLVPVQLPGPAGMVMSPTTGAQSLATFTGFQFLDNGSCFIVIYVGSGGTGNLTQTFGKTIESVSSGIAPVTLANSTNYLFGTWSVSDFTRQDGSGLVEFDLTGTQTGNTITLYQLSPAS
jgi:hypothetical protein